MPSDTKHIILTNMYVKVYRDYCNILFLALKINMQHSIEHCTTDASIDQWYS